MPDQNQIKTGAAPARPKTGPRPLHRVKPGPAGTTAEAHGAAAELNKAQAAHDQHSQKQAEAAAPPPGVPGPGFPMPGWGAPLPLPPVPAWPGAGMPGMPGGPLAQEIGQMLRLGVAFATAAFTGGLQVMQGFAGPGAGPLPQPPDRPGCGCGGGGSRADDHGCGCGCECGCERTDCCHVGVRNCRCGCC